MHQWEYQTAQLWDSRNKHFISTQSINLLLTNKKNIFDSSLTNSSFSSRGKCFLKYLFFWELADGNDLQCLILVTHCMIQTKFQMASVD
jgi:hypothetical protein